MDNCETGNKKPLVPGTEGRARGDETTSGHAPRDYYDDSAHGATVANRSKRCQAGGTRVSPGETSSPSRRRSGAGRVERERLRPQPLDQRHTDAGGGGQHAGAWRQLVAVERQRQRRLAEHDRGRGVAGVALGGDLGDEARAAGGPG